MKQDIKTGSKGYSRRADIPDDYLRKLNAGEIESWTLSEWLAVDMPVLLKNVLVETDIAEVVAEDIYREVADISDEGFMTRLRSIGASFHRAAMKTTGSDRLFEKLAAHRSDTVRQWAAFMIEADESLSFGARLTTLRRFACDSNMGVRESAWLSFRSSIEKDLPGALRLLESWVHDPDPCIRRCAVEGSRPRGVWCRHIGDLKRDPEPGLVLLEPVRSDLSRYVQLSVANWLNDASKSTPSWVLSICNRWKAESPTDETDWIVHHALRTLRKKGKG